MAELPENVVKVLPDVAGPDGQLALGRSIVEHDPRSRDYPLSEALDRLEVDAPPRAWFRRGVFDQNLGGPWNGHQPESSCTFQMAAGMLVTSPHRHHSHIGKRMPDLLSAQFRFSGYRLAQTLDPWEGEEPSYYGSSTIAAMKAAKVLGLVPESWQYRWSFQGVDEIKRALRVGPVGLGTEWREGMDNPDRHGKVTIDGDVRGGHAWYLHDYDEDEDGTWFDAINSWGLWGLNGRFRIREDHLQELLDADGEAVAWIPS